MGEYTEESLTRLGAKELARRFLIAERVRKHWRVLALEAATGRINMDGLKMVCFRELLGIVPEDAELDERLHALVDEAEERENLVEVFGTLRSIDLGGDDIPDR